ncbi:hypothetical protein XBFM1_1660018 [Xenorhabdus bovienii str. feltiae Moldova]|uniref:Uncharacterized protein n=1 Tax=Xenorhabdus bovienii str. feltiae Moldova TaxID=1398200 RepID=A0A077NPW5_XENBV|nr:hypothetical protein XBFM1_1660018 [Xenorhabdus bovienii str. feltiae Moldova]
MVEFSRNKKIKLMRSPNPTPTYLEVFILLTFTTVIFICNFLLLIPIQTINNRISTAL